jgi:excisionase family DNA binding protein
MTSLKPPVSRLDIHEALVRPLLVTIAQAGEILCVSRTTLYELIWSGQLRSIHIGRSMRVSVEDLEDFVDARMRISDDSTASDRP